MLTLFFWRIPNFLSCLHANLPAGSAFVVFPHVFLNDAVECSMDTVRWCASQRQKSLIIYSLYLHQRNMYYNYMRENSSGNKTEERN